MSFRILQRASATGRMNGAAKKLVLAGRPTSVTGVQSRSITDYMRDRSEKSEDNILDVRRVLLV